MTTAQNNRSKGFTIVELLIVIVVIGILAAITIVGFNGVQNRAKTASIQTAVSQANKKVLAYAALNSDQYPATLSDIGINDTNEIKYQYTVNNTANPRTYAVTASNDFNGGNSFYLSSTQPKITSGIAPGHNLAVWNKPNASTSPVTIVAGVVVDTSTYRTSTASLRIAPNSAGRALAGNLFSGSVGQTYTVSFWIKSDADWNGTNGNSKIRFGSATNGTFLTACVYNGVKTTWTFVSCSYTLDASNTAVQVTVGNDGTVGSIWLDDIVVSLQ